MEENDPNTSAVKPPGKELAVFTGREAGEQKSCPMPGVEFLRRPERHVRRISFIQSLHFLCLLFPLRITIFFWLLSLQ
jgi:hypothetical protein